MKAKYLFFILLFSNILFSQFEQEEYFQLNIAQDPINGFYPTVAGAFPITEDLDISFYGTFWTQDLLGGGEGGLNLYTEFAVGINYYLFEKHLIINPNLGIIGGNYHSGGGRPVIGDGFVPSLYFLYSNDKFSLNSYFTAWLPLRKESNISPFYKNYDVTIEASYQLLNWFEPGLYFEYYSEKGNSSYPLALWIGPQISLLNQKGHSLSFAFGLDFVDHINNNIPKEERILRDFYKLSATINL